MYFKLFKFVEKFETSKQYFSLSTFSVNSAIFIWRNWSQFVANETFSRNKKKNPIKFETSSANYLSIWAQYQARSFYLGENYEFVENIVAQCYQVTKVLVPLLHSQLIKASLREIATLVELNYCEKSANFTHKMWNCVNETKFSIWNSHQNFINKNFS